MSFKCKTPVLAGAFFNLYIKYSGLGETTTHVYVIGLTIDMRVWDLTGF